MTSVTTEFSQFADLFPEALLLVAVDGTVRDLNDGCVERFGGVRSSLIGANLASLCADPPEAVTRYLQSCARTSRFLPGSLLLKGPDGKQLPHRCEGAVLRGTRGNGNPHVVLRLIPRDAAVSRFVTLNQRLEDLGLEVARRREIGERLAEAVRQKDEFIAMLGHELRNPLAPLRNGIAILQMSNGHDPQLTTLAAMMERQLTHLDRLVEDLLDVSRLTRGKIRLELQPVALADVLARAVEMVQPLIERQQHKLEVTLPDEAVRVRADSARLCQVLANVLTNAVNFTSPGGLITVTTRTEPGFVSVLLRDNGCGIASHHIATIFEPFTQLDHSQGRSSGGLGLGLTLARGLVELQGGSMEAHSQGPGQGSEFVIRVPLLPTTAAVLQSTAAGKVRTPRTEFPRRVLVVDDNVDFVSTMAKLLRLWGHDVRSSHTGAEALDIAAEFQPEVVLLDLGLPGASGHEVASVLRSRREGSHVLLVAVTGWGQESDRKQSRDAGFDLHLTKPVDPETVRTLLAQFVPHTRPDIVVQQRPGARQHHPSLEAPHHRPEET